MDNSQNRQRPKMSFARRFWHIWGPFLINWGIGIAASIAAVVIFLGAYMAEHTGEMLAAYGDRDAMAEITYKVLEVLQRYTTQTEGVSALVVIPVMLYLYRRDRNLEKAYGIQVGKKVPAVKYILVAAIAFSMSIALNSLILISQISNQSKAYQEVTEAFYSPSIGIQVLCLGLLCPIAEELVFRGLMYRRLREDTGFVTAAIYTAVVFGLFHGNMVQMLYATALGLMFAYVCEKYGSVLAPIVAHVTANLVSIFATYWNIYGKILSNILITGIITVGCATTSAIIFQIMRQMDVDIGISKKGNSVEIDK